jgi:V8-like Glu-specific endopeptidase
VSTKERLSADETGEVESPFLDEELFVGASEEEWEPRAAALAAESPFVEAVTTTRGPADVELEEEEPSDRRKCKRGYGIIGDRDDRVKVNKTWRVPYRWICQISVRMGNLRRFSPAGTGVLISPHYVLTAAHILRYSEKDKRNQWVDMTADYVVVTPARDEEASDDKKEPFGKYQADSWMIGPKYDPRASDSWKYDYAIIRLKEAVGAKEFPLLQKKRLCYWGSYDCGENTFLEVLDKARLEDKTACTAGYPHDRGAGKTMWFAAGKLTGVDLIGRAEVMNITADACHGQSGSPVWIKKDGKRYLVGILKRIGTGISNSALRINQEVFDQISKWFEAAKETPELEAAQSLEKVEVEEELEAEESREALEDEYEEAEDEEVEWKADSEEQIEDAEGTDYEEKADEENFGFQDEDESRQSRFKRLSNQYDEEELEAAFLDELSESMVVDLKEPSAIESDEELDERLKSAPGSAPKCYQIVSSTTGNLPAINFEFDMNYGASTVRPPLEQPDHDTVYSLEGKKITTHRIKQEGFRLEGDGNRIEIGTKHFELSD